MSVSGISSSSFFDYSSQSVQNTFQNKGQQIQQEFQQLGEDLQSGNLSAAQSDFATLQQLAPQPNSSSTQSNNPIAQAFKQLAQDLQSGNLSAAQQDFTTIQQDFQKQNSQNQAVQNQAFQNQAGQAGSPGSQPQVAHHRHGGGGSAQSQISQVFDELGQSLQSGDLSTAQQLFSTLQQDFQNLGRPNEVSAAQGSGTGTVSLSA